MKWISFLLLAVLVACNNSSDTPKRAHPVDNTETEPKKDTNRVELPADSAAGTQGLLFPTDVPGQGFVGRQAQSKKEDSGRVVNHFSFAPGVAIVFSSVIRSPYLPDAKPKETAGSLI